MIKEGTLRESMDHRIPEVINHRTLGVKEGGKRLKI